MNSEQLMTIIAIMFFIGVICLCGAVIYLYLVEGKRPGVTEDPEEDEPIIGPAVVCADGGCIPDVRYPGTSDVVGDVEKMIVLETALDLVPEIEEIVYQSPQYVEPIAPEEQEDRDPVAIYSDFEPEEESSSYSDE